MSFQKGTHSGQPANHQASLLFLRRESFGAVRTLVAQRLAFGETHSKLRFVAPLSPCIREADDVASMRGRGGWSRRIKKSASNSFLIEGIVCVCITVRCHHDFSSFSRRASLLSESKNAPLGNQAFFKLQENGRCRDATPPRTCSRPTKPSS